MFRSYGVYSQYLNSRLVIFIAGSLTCSGIGAGFDDRLAPSDKTVGFNLAGSILLSAFVYVGLGGIRAESISLYNDLNVLENKDPLRGAENNYGSKDTSLSLANFGRLIGFISVCVNLAYAVMHLSGKTVDNPVAWAFSVLVISTLANLIGFVLFNILGARNHQFFVAKHTALDALKDGLIVDLQQQVRNLVPVAGAEGVFLPGGAISPLVDVAGAVALPRR